MAAPVTDKLRCKRGRFTTVKKEKWKENVRTAVKRRKLTNLEECEQKIEGRRVVELAQLANDLWCKTCCQPLSLRFFVEEKLIGLASVLKIRCHGCLAIFEVHTCKKQWETEGCRPRYDVNLKAAVGILDAGIGEAHLNTLLSALNVPVVHPRTLKANERIVGSAIESVAAESCREAIRLEKDLTLQKYGSTALTDDGRVKIKGSIDAAWQTRGNGRSYDSQTGHCSLIGALSGQVLGKAVRIKICALCSNGHDPKDHDCRSNFHGSAKAMEPDMAVELVVHNKDLEDENVIIATVIGDEDASTMCRIRRESSHVVEKESDMNHITKSLSNKLWKLRLPKQTIDYLKRCFGCAIKMNRGDPDGVEKALRNVVDHAFDNHEMCGEWCRFREDPQTYKHHGLPGGKGLQGTQLYTDLKKIFDTYAGNSQKIAACSSTQPNESFNSLVSRKASKARCYGRSASLVYRVDAAVSQKNIGTKYIQNVNEKLCISPGKHTVEFRSRKDINRKNRALKCKTAEFKRRRLFLKAQRSRNHSSAVRREGITYASECALSEEIVIREEVCVNSTRDTVAVIFDLETTGFGPNAEVIQIAAKYNDEQFSCYILPSKGIPHVVSEVTGLSIEEGQLILTSNGEHRCVKTTPPRIACAEFISFLKTISNNVILVAHKGITFDGPQVVKAMQAVGLLEEFGSIVKGFTDTLPIFKTCKNLASRVVSKGSFKQSDLAHDYLGPESAKGAHNAVIDVQILRDLLHKFEITEKELITRAVSFLSVANAGQVRKDKKNRIEGMAALKGPVSAAMIAKIAGAGFTLARLESTFAANGENGIAMLLGEDIGGKPRVTKNKAVLRKLCEILCTRSNQCVSSAL